MPHYSTFPYPPLPTTGEAVFVLCLVHDGEYNDYPTMSTLYFTPQGDPSSDFSNAGFSLALQLLIYEYFFGAWPYADRIIFNWVWRLTDGTLYSGYSQNNLDIDNPFEVGAPQALAVCVHKIVSPHKRMGRYWHGQFPLSWINTDRTLTAYGAANLDMACSLLFTQMEVYGYYFNPVVYSPTNETLTPIIGWEACGKATTKQTRYYSSTSRKVWEPLPVIPDT